MFKRLRSLFSDIFRQRQLEVTLRNGTLVSIPQRAFYLYERNVLIDLDNLKQLAWM